MYFQSFDGHIFTFSATCQYVLAKSRNSGKFTVTIQNAPCGAVSYSHSVLFFCFINKTFHLVELWLFIFWFWNKCLYISHTTFLLQPLETKCAAVSAHGFVCHVDHIIIWVLSKPLLNPSRSFFCWRALLRLRKMKTSTKPLNETVADNEHEREQKSKGFLLSPLLQFHISVWAAQQTGRIWDVPLIRERPETSSSQVNKITLYLTWLTELLDSLVVRRGGTERRWMMGRVQGGGYLTISLMKETIHWGRSLTVSDTSDLNAVLKCW